MIVLANGIGFLVSIIMPCYNQGVFVAEASKRPNLGQDLILCC